MSPFRALLAFISTVTGSGVSSAIIFILTAPLDGVSSVSITGAIQDPFVDRFTYVDEGRSDLNQTPTTVERIVNMPDDKIFFKCRDKGARLGARANCWNT